MNILDQIKENHRHMSEFYTIETPPPSSSTIDESLTLFQSKKRMKLIGQIPNRYNNKIDEVRIVSMEIY